MRRALAPAVALLLAVPAGAPAAVDPARVAERLRAHPVYVQPGASPSLSRAETRRLAARIERRTPGRLRLAVLRRRDVTRAGGAATVANAVDRELGLPGSLVVVAGSAYYSVVSWGSAEQATDVLRGAVAAHRGDLAAQLRAVVDRTADLDPREPLPARPRPVVPPPAPAPAVEMPSAFEDLFDTVKTVLLVGAAIVVAPFAIVALLLVRRARRRSVLDREALAATLDAVRAEHLALGDEIGALDLDVSMPGAAQEGVDAYGAALARYDEASRLLLSADDAPAAARVREAVAEGRRLMAQARAALERAPAP